MLPAQAMLTGIRRKRLAFPMRGFDVRHRIHARHAITVIHIAILSSLKMLHAPRFNASRKGRACWIAYNVTSGTAGKLQSKMPVLQSEYLFASMKTNFSAR